MLSHAALKWRGDIILTSDLDLSSARSEFYRRARRGEFHAIFVGVYVRADVWSRASADERYLLTIAGAVAIAPGAVISHESAAAVWRLPRVGNWPRRVHVLQERSSHDRSTSAFIRHSVGVPTDLALVDGLTVTSLARTVIDVAASAPFGVAVAMADAALRRSTHPMVGIPPTSLSKQDLVEAGSRLHLRQGSVKARRVVDFADASADRPGESMSRVAMHIAKMTPPMLQVTLYGASGTRYVVDFWWPAFNVIGEFDGWSKYTDPEFLDGRSPEEALRDEKRREDDLRAAGHGMTRWDWRVALSPARLREHLFRAGVR